MAEETVSTVAEPTSAPAAPAEPSTTPETHTVPTDPKAYEEWRYGKPKAASAPAKKSDAKPQKAQAEGDQEPGDAAESEPAQAERQTSKAQRRLNELLEDLRKAGLSPSELKNFKRELKAAEDQPKAPPEKRTENAPANGSDAPKKPSEKDFDTWEKYEEARDQYYEELAAYKARHAVEEYRQSQRQESAQKEMTERLTEAKKRYGEEAESTIVGAAKAIFQDDAIPGAIREILNGSSAIVDVLYALGKDGDELSDFVELCKTDPGAALRKAVLVEKFVLEELGKPNGQATPRDADGKFTAQGKKPSNAPPPPRQVSGTAGPPVDEVSRAVEKGDFRTYMEVQNRKDLARFRGQ